MTVTVEHLQAEVSVNAKPAFGELLALKGSLVGVGIAAVQSLAGAGVALTSALAPSVGILAAIPTGIGAVIQSAIGLKAVTGGLTEAIQAQGAAQKATTVTGLQATQQAQSRRAASWGLEDALRAVTDAEKALAKAQKPADVLDVRQAALSLRSARLEQASATAAAVEMERELNKATQQTYRSVMGLKDDFTGKTIEFTTEVKGTKTDPLKIAREREAAAIRIEAAELGVLEAQKAQYELSQKGTAQDEAVISAQRQLEATHRSLIVAQEAYTQAQVDGGAAATAALDAVAQAMAKLSPAGRDFVDMLMGEWKPAWEDLQKAAQEAFFGAANPGLRDATTHFVVFKDAIVKTAEIFGKFAGAVGSFFGDAGVARDMKRIFDDNNDVIEVGVDLLGDLMWATKDLMIAADPMIEWLSRGAALWGENVRQWADAGRESGKLRDFFEKTMAVMDLLQDTAKDFGGALKDIGTAATPLGTWILAATKRNADEMERWTSKAKNAQKIKDYFNEMKDPLTQAAGLITDIGKGLIELNNQRQVEDVIKLIREQLLPAVLNVVEGLQQTGVIEALIPALTQMVDIFDRLYSGSHMLSTVLDGIATSLNIIVGILDLPVIGTAIGSILALKTAFALLGTTASVALQSFGGAHMAAALNSLGSFGAATRAASNGWRDFSANLASGQGRGRALRTFGQDMRTAVGAMGAFNAALIGAGGIVFAMSIYNKKADETKAKAQALASELASSVGKFVEEGDYDTVKAKLVETQTQIGNLDNEIRNSKGVLDMDYRDGLSQLRNELSTEIVDPFAPLINQAEEMAEKYGTTADAAYNFLTKQKNLGIEYKNSRDAMKDLREETQQYADEALQSAYEKALDLLDAEEQLRRNKLSTGDAVAEYDKIRNEALADGVITPEEQSQIESAYQAVYDSMERVANGALEIANAKAEEENRTLSVTEQNDILTTSWKEQADLLGIDGDLRVAIDGHITKLGEIPKEAHTAVFVDFIKTGAAELGSLLTGFRGTLNPFSKAFSNLGDYNRTEWGLGTKDEFAGISFDPKKGFNGGNSFDPTAPSGDLGAGNGTVVFNNTFNEKADPAAISAELMWTASRGGF